MTINIIIILLSIILFLEIVSYILRFINWILKRKLKKIKQENDLYKQASKIPEVWHIDYCDNCKQIINHNSSGKCLKCGMYTYVENNPEY